VEKVKPGWRSGGKDARKESTYKREARGEFGRGEVISCLPLGLCR